MSFNSPVKALPDQLKRRSSLGKMKAAQYAVPLVIPITVHNCFDQEERGQSHYPLRLSARGDSIEQRIPET
jgi:hypothetical protein